MCVYHLPNWVDWFSYPSLPDQLSICACEKVTPLGQTARNALTEAFQGFRVSLHSRCVNCVKNCNCVDRDSKLMCVNALILTALIETVKNVFFKHLNLLTQGAAFIFLDDEVTPVWSSCLAPGETRGVLDTILTLKQRNREGGWKVSEKGLLK